MKITGVLVEMLVKLDSETYRKHVVFENGNKLIYVVLLREIYGMFVAEILLYRKFCGDLENIGFDFNPYDPCVASRIKFGKQHALRFHAEDFMSSHVNPKVNYKFKEWMNRNDGNHGEVKSNRGKLHKYPGMTFDFTGKSKVKTRMDDYVESIINEFPMKISKSYTALTPSGNNIFEKGNSKRLGRK